MVVKTRNILTESEINGIRQQYGLSPLKRDYVFEACVTIDGRYFVVRDQIFDNVEQRTLGNIWESLDMFKTIFTNVKVDENEEYSQIREGILSTPILEGVDNLYEIRDYLLEWNFFDDTWLGSKLKSAGTAIGDTFEKGWRGVKKLGVAISKGEWSQIWDLLKRGVKWILRKLKEAMYSTLGIIVDGILIATGIGKGAVAIAWALVLGLDIYQFINNDWPSEDKNSPTWMHFLDIGFDILGLVAAGGVAKGAKLIFEPLKKLGAESIEVAARWLEKSPAAKSIVEKMYNGIKKVPALMESALSFLSKKFPKGYEFIKGIMGSLVNVLKRIGSWFYKLLGFGKEEKILTGTQKIKRGVSAGTIGTGLSYGIEKGMAKLAPAIAGGNQNPYQDVIKYNNQMGDNPDAYNI